MSGDGPGKPGPYKFEERSSLEGEPYPKNRESVGDVAAEERIGLPVRWRGSVGGLEEQTAREFLVEGGGVEIDGLVGIVGGSVVSIG